MTQGMKRLDNRICSAQHRSQEQSLRRFARETAKRANEAVLYQILNETMEGCNKSVVRELHRILLKRVHRHMTVNTAGRIEKYFIEHEQFYFSGYTLFRMKQERAQMALLVDGMLKDYALEKSCEGFVSLLRSYAKSQHEGEPVHIYQLKNRYLLLDAAYDPVGESRVLDADLLLAELLERTPEKITIHNLLGNRLERVVETIKKIFDDRVEICYNRRNESML